MYVSHEEARVVLLFWTNYPHPLRSSSYSKVSGSGLNSCHVSLFLCACLKPLSGDNYPKMPYPRKQQCDLGAG